MTKKSLDSFNFGNPYEGSEKENTSLRKTLLNILRRDVFGKMTEGKEITDETRFMEDLGFDELDIIELGLQIIWNEDIEINEIPDEEFYGG